MEETFHATVKTDDSLAYIINETAARMVGWSNEEAIGKVLKNGLDKREGHRGRQGFSF